MKLKPRFPFDLDLLIDYNDPEKFSQNSLKLDQHILNKLFDRFENDSKKSSNFTLGFASTSILLSCNDNQFLQIIISKEKYITDQYLKNLLHETEILEERNTITSLMKTNESYKMTMMKLLNMTDNNKDNIKTYEMKECPLCFGKQELILNCGHTICMLCAVEWYIDEKKELKCITCNNDINFKNCICLL
jgi:hypothetical protein